jgi:hypothetical protein
MGKTLRSGRTGAISSDLVGTMRELRANPGFLPMSKRRATLVLKSHRLYSKSGIMALAYDIER